MEKPGHGGFHGSQVDHQHVLVLEMSKHYSAKWPSTEFHCQAYLDS